ncbi:MAG: cob(I)yrinic acid a,c-diamide adenosyltransferase [Acidimicrobiia bacterium]
MDRTNKPSLVLVHTGDGKGKSSSAWGVMARAWARGWTVGVVQFIKSGDWKVGEEKLARQLGIEWNALGDGFTWDSNDMEATKARALHAWEVSKAKLASGDYDMLILDEITYLAAWGWVDADEIAAAVRDRASRTNVVLTGRDAPSALIDVADTVTEMRMVKHAFVQGINARKGIEY